MNQSNCGDPNQVNRYLINRVCRFDQFEWQSPKQTTDNQCSDRIKKELRQKVQMAEADEAEADGAEADQLVLSIRLTYGTKVN